MIPHKIRPNKQNTIPTRMIFVDTEANETCYPDKCIQTLRLGTAVYVRIKPDLKTIEHWITFTKPIEFWEFVDNKTEKKRSLWVIAHNWQYDFLILQGLIQLPRLGYELKRFALDNNNFILAYTKNDRKILLIDSMNYFKTSIAQMGAQLGLPKINIDPLKANDKELLEYNKRDVEILKEYFIRFLIWWKQNNMGKFGLTLASLAYNTFRHKFLSHDLYVHNNQEALELEKRSYRGGRNEAFQIGEVNQTLYYLDVNSMYPYVMKEYLYPTRLKAVLGEISTKYLRRLLQDYMVIADVFIDTNEPVYGVKRQKLIFPIGRFRTTLTTPELVYALTYGHIKRVYKVAIYYPGKVFEEFVDFFYELKHNAETRGDKLTRTFAKLLMNSLYGKFAQRKRERIPIDYPNPEPFGYTWAIDSRTGKRMKIIFINHNAYALAPSEKLFRDAMISIASHVTANARMYLWYLIKTAGLDNVFYVDTDSLIVNEKGYSHIRHLVGDALGQLKLEKVVSKAVFFGPKDYILETETKTKGIPKNSVQIAPNIYLVTRFKRLLTSISEGTVDRVEILQVIKQLTRQYDKGIVLPNGRVAPLVLNETP